MVDLKLVQDATLCYHHEYDWRRKYLIRSLNHGQESPLMLPRWLKSTRCPLSYNVASVHVKVMDLMRSDWRKSQGSHRDDDGTGS